MITKTLYVCKYCLTDYADKDRAMECEMNHKEVKISNLTVFYKSKKLIPDGYPVRIRIAGSEGNKAVEYRR